MCSGLCEHVLFRHISTDQGSTFGFIKDSGSRTPMIPIVIQVPHFISSSRMRQSSWQHNSRLGCHLV